MAKIALASDVHLATAIMTIRKDDNEHELQAST